MKKISLALVVLLILVLSGCDSNTMETLDVGGHETYYTQEEVDELLEDYVQRVYLDSGSDICFIIHGEEYDCWNDYYTRDELNEIFDFAEQDWTVQDFVDYIDDLEDIVGNLEQRIDELEDITNKSVCVFPTATYIVVDYETRDGYVYMTDVNGTEYYQLASLEHECINFEFFVIRALTDE